MWVEHEYMLTNGQEENKCSMGVFEEPDLVDQSDVAGKSIKKV